VNDILERALESVKPETLETNSDLKNFYEGVQMTEKLLLKAYEQNDIKRFSPIGQKFDPNLHQALQEVVDPSKETGTVYYVMKAGYQLKDRLLRAASVAVVKADPNTVKAPTEDKKEEPVASS
jgi:molecular chaperone GrpE